MTATIDKVSLPERNALIIHDSVNMMKLGKVMGPAYMKLGEYIQKKGFKLAEAPFTKYNVPDWEATVNMSFFKMLQSIFTQKWDIDMGYEVPMSLAGDTTIKPITLSSGEYLQTLHMGPYHKVGGCYKKIYQFAREHNLTLGPCSYEYYLNDPGKVARAALETRVVVPLK